MEQIELANAMIAAALIQSGQFKLSEFDERGRPIHGRMTDHRTQAECFMQQAEVLGEPSFDSYASPALTSLRQLTNAIRRSLYEAPSLRTGDR